MKEQDKSQIQYWVGVDGGGTGTRVLLTDQYGVKIGRGCAGPSSLAHGVAAAWQSILAAVALAFEQANRAMPALSEIAIGCGLAGANNLVWAKQFTISNPGFGVFFLETDAKTSLLGAHHGQAGVVIALGTGSVGEVMLTDGSCREVGGWGFPSGDEASGAWIGLRAMNYAQHVLDGRSASDEFAVALIQFCGGDRDAVLAWLAQATQTHFAQLAPIVIQYAGVHPKAKNIVDQASSEVEKMALALDPHCAMPIALCGGLAEAILPYLSADLRARVVAPLGDSALGALMLVASQTLGAQLGTQLGGHYHDFVVELLK